MDSTATAPPLEVFLVDDSPLIRERLLALLACVPGARTVGCAERADEAVQTILAQRPDAVVLDVHLAEGSSGIDVLRALHDQAPEIDVFMLTNFASNQNRRLCERLGARAVYDKSTEFERMRDAIAALACSRGDNNKNNRAEQPCKP